MLFMDSKQMFDQMHHNKTQFNSDILREITSVDGRLGGISIY